MTLPAASSLLSAEPDQRAAELLARAVEMIPNLRARERAAIQQGQIPSETVDDFMRAGLFRVLQPTRYGGYELPPEVYFNIARTLAEGCMSSAWVYAVLAVHNWQLALFDDRAAQEVWASDPDAARRQSCG